MSRRYPRENTRRWEVYNLLSEYAVQHRGLPAIRQCHEIANQGLDKPISWSRFHKLWLQLRLDGLIEVDEYHGTNSIKRSELWLQEVDS